MIHSHAPIRMAKIQNPDNQMLEGHGATGMKSHSLLVGMLNGIATLEKFLTKLNTFTK